MSAAAPTTAGLQADALIGEIAQRAAHDRRDLLDAAAREAEEVRRRARLKARRQLRRAVADLRAHEQRRLQQARAEIETEQRRHESARALAALALAWPRLAQALERRWRDPRSRAGWIDAHLEMARARLGHTAWWVRHPADASPSDVAALQAALDAHGAQATTLRADPQLQAGLVVEVDGAALDTTPAALLADPDAIQAELLAALDDAAGGGPLP